MFGIIFQKILLCPLTLEIGHHLHPDISSLYVLSMPRAYPQSFSYAANTARNAAEDEEERCLTLKKEIRNEILKHLYMLLIIKTFSLFAIQHM